MAEATAAFLTNPLEAYLTFSEPRRAWVYAIAAVLIAIIAYGDWKLEDVSLGFLYVLPILMAAPGVACNELKYSRSTAHAMASAQICHPRRVAAAMRIGSTYRKPRDTSSSFQSPYAMMAISTPAMAYTQARLGSENVR